MTGPASATFGTFAAPDEPPPPSAPPSPARTEPEDTPGGADGAEDPEKLAALEGAAAAAAARASASGGYPCHWNRSGLRGVYEVDEPADEEKRWEAVLPVRTTKGRTPAGDVFKHQSLGFFATAQEAGEAFATAADAAKEAADSSQGDQMLSKDPLAKLLPPLFGEPGAAESFDMNVVFKEVDREDREDGRRDRIDLISSERSESGYKGVHRSGGKSGKWQTQVFYAGQLYHIGHHEDPRTCARTMALCTRLIINLRRRGLLPSTSGGRGPGRRKRESLAMPAMGDAVTAFEGSDASLPVHSNPAAETGCQGVYYHASIGHFGVIAPGNAMLGYYQQPKEAALTFSRHVATVAAALGRRKATIRPWPRNPIDERRYHRITLASCGLESVDPDYARKADDAVQVAEALYELLGKVEQLVKEEEAKVPTASSAGMQLVSTSGPLPVGALPVGGNFGALPVAFVVPVVPDVVPVAKLLSVSDLPNEAVVVAQATLKPLLELGVKFLSGKGLKFLKKKKEKKEKKIKEKKEKKEKVKKEKKVKIKKEPPPPKEKKEKKVKFNVHDHCDPMLRLDVGTVVEVRQRDGSGFDGAWYTAAIQAVLPGGKVRVQYEVGTEYVDELSQEAVGGLVTRPGETSAPEPMEVDGESSVAMLTDKDIDGEIDVVPISRVRPVPPKLTAECAKPEMALEHAHVLGNTEVGDTLEMLYMGGWWQVTMVENPVLQPRPEQQNAPMDTDKAASTSVTDAPAEGGTATDAPNSVSNTVALGGEDAAAMAMEDATEPTDADAASKGLKKGRKSGGGKSKDERYDRPVPPADVLASAQFTVKALKFTNEHTGVTANMLRPLWVWKRRGGKNLTKSGKLRKSIGGEGAEGDLGVDGGAEEAEDLQKVEDGDQGEAAQSEAKDSEHKDAAVKDSEAIDGELNDGETNDGGDNIGRVENGEVTGETKDDEANDGGVNDGGANGHGVKAEGEDLAEGDAMEGFWGRSRGREGKPNKSLGGFPLRMMGEPVPTSLPAPKAGGGAKGGVAGAGTSSSDADGAAGGTDDVPGFRDFVVGDGVEARSNDEDFEGSRYAATIVAINALDRRAEVEYEVSRLHSCV